MKATRLTHSLVALVLLFLLTFSIASAQQPQAASSQRDTPTLAVNQLTAAEQAAGWKLLFDGKTSNGWRGFHKTEFPKAGWTIADGCIKHVAGKGAQSEDGGDIITVDQFDNFELQLEWRLAPGGNSGIKYLITEALPPTGGSGVGFEMQVLDDERHPDAKMGLKGNRTAGSLYDLIPAQNKRLRSAGEFNQIRLIVNNGHVEHWLNGDKVVEFELGSEPLRALIAESKYKTIAGFGEARKGYILLQDHGDEVCFRNIKIRQLKGNRPRSSSSQRN